ncbi:hypothetical protein PINS_up021449, partial [Pythium insidiosum]
AIGEGPPSVKRRKAYVQRIERREEDLVRFCEYIALKYLGHRLIHKLLPTPPTLLTVVS